MYKGNTEGLGQLNLIVIAGKSKVTDVNFPTAFECSIVPGWKRTFFT